MDTVEGVSRSLFLLRLTRSTGEGELGNAGFIELTFAKLDHSIVLILGGLGKWEVESGGLSEFESDPGVF